MPEIKWGTTGKTEKEPFVWKHEPAWYVAVGLLSVVAVSLVVGLIWLAAIGIWVPVVIVGFIAVVAAVIASLVFLADYYGWY